MLEINGLITITRHNKKNAVTAVTAVTEINAGPSRNDTEHAAARWSLGAIIRIEEPTKSNGNQRNER